MGSEMCIRDSPWSVHECLEYFFGARVTDGASGYSGGELCDFVCDVCDIGFAHAVHQPSNLVEEKHDVILIASTER